MGRACSLTDDCYLKSDERLPCLVDCYLQRMQDCATPMAFVTSKQHQILFRVLCRLQHHCCLLYEQTQPFCDCALSWMETTNTVVTLAMHNCSGRLEKRAEWSR